MSGAGTCSCVILRAKPWTGISPTGSSPTPNQGHNKSKARPLLFPQHFGQGPMARNNQNDISKSSLTKTPTPMPGWPVTNTVLCSTNQPQSMKSPPRRRQQVWRGRTLSQKFRRLGLWHGGQDPPFAGAVYNAICFAHGRYFAFPSSWVEPCRIPGHLWIGPIPCCWNNRCGRRKGLCATVRAVSRNRASCRW
jgi:hypothetical protein